tara:strand:+ start:6609 stop:6767 length:159 start_codon:yes stop_codon:yes gene_type:complete
MSVFLKYKGIEVIYEPHFEQYFIVDEEWESKNDSGLDSLEKAKNYIDNIKDE